MRHVGDDEQRRAALPVELRRGDGVCRLTALTDGDRQRVVPENGVAVAVLARNARFRGDAREPLNGKFPREPAVIRRASSDEMDLFELPKER